MRVAEQEAPRCPAHVNVTMKPIANLKVFSKAGRSGRVKFGVLRDLALYDRFRCPVAGCSRVETLEKKTA